MQQFNGYVGQKWGKNDAIDFSCLDKLNSPKCFKEKGTLSVLGRMKNSINSHLHHFCTNKCLQLLQVVHK